MSIYIADFINDRSHNFIVIGYIFFSFLTSYFLLFFVVLHNQRQTDDELPVEVFAPFYSLNYIVYWALSIFKIWETYTQFRVFIVD